MSAIELRGVSFTYEGAAQPALRGVSLRVSRGEFTALMGRTGCGKTTLLLTLNGIIPKTIRGEFAGEVRVLGESVAQATFARMAERIAFVFQDPSDQLFCETAREEIAFGLRLRGLSEKEVNSRVKNSLRAVGLAGFEECDPLALSQGQKQKLCLATALATGAPVLALDEPAASLDYENASRVYEILSRLNSTGKTILVVEHDSDVVARYADRVVILENGVVVEDAAPSILKSKRVARYGVKPVQ
ncbi:MAG: ABC transporter ATP-binding protein [Candidatus Norongarragalinales archaeon]